MLECSLRAALALILPWTFVLAQGAPARLIGVISAIAPDGKGLVVKTDGGEERIAALLEDARIARVAPGEKDLSKAAPAAVSDLSPGDRVLVRGEMAPGGKVLLARQVIVMTRDDLAKKQQAERAEWAKRGTSGIVAAKNETQKTLTLRIPGLDKDQIVEAALSENTRIRRYAPDSVRYADAKPGTLSEIQPGDQVRVLGNRDSEGKKIMAEEIVSGAFQTIAGSVLAVHPDGSGFSIKDLKNGKPLSVKTTADSVVKRLPERGPGFGTGGMGMGMGMPSGGMGSGAPDLQRMLEFLPAASVNDLKPGDTVLLAATRAADSQPVTAITVLANAGTLLAMRQALSSRQRGGSVDSGSWTLDMPVMMGP